MSASQSRDELGLPLESGSGTPRQTRCIIADLRHLDEAAASTGTSDPNPPTGDPMHAFLLSFGVIFLAELGDKSQLMAMAFATRFRAWTVLLAVTLATLLVHAGSVLVGSLFALALPTSLIQVVAGVAFFVFAAWTIRGDELGESDEGRAKRSGRWALLTIGTAFFLAELGDKTMLATITLATTEEPIGTWLGSTAGMVAADALAIAVGALLGTRLPERAVKVFAAAAFVVFGAILVAEGLNLL
jgi:putative Ca2+/H+ antiporter (TMEM165/GDT1 family)